MTTTLVLTVDRYDSRSNQTLQHHWKITNCIYTHMNRYVTPIRVAVFLKLNLELNNLFQVLQRLVRKQCHVLLLINKTLAQENNHRLAVRDTRRDVKER